MGHRTLNLEVDKIFEKNQNFFTESSWDLKIGMQSPYTVIQKITPI